jgi:hypothetical protein
MSDYKKFFVGQNIKPDGNFDPVAMSHGEPSLPTSFQWQNETLEIKSSIRSWRTTKDDRGEEYLAKHWYELELTDGRRAVVYFDRHGKTAVQRWWLYTMEEL